MKLVTIPHSRMLAGVANMLECFDYDVNDRSIALGMEAPYLLLRNEGNYIAGMGLFQPQWINLYLHTIGFHLDHRYITRDELPSFLRSCKTALLPLYIRKEMPHIQQPLVFTGMNRGRYVFTNLKQRHSTEPDTLSLTTPMLLSKSADSIRIYTLSAITPEQIDFLPYLQQSLMNLDTLKEELPGILAKHVTREEFETLKETHLGALMNDLPPIACIGNDRLLARELLIVNHYYSNVFQRYSPERVLLRNKLPFTFIKNSLTWLREDIVDRMYAYGATDNILE